MIISVTDVVLYATYFFLLFFSIFWLLVLFSSEEKTKKKISRFPTFITIVPAYNEEESIISTLNSLVQLDYPQEKMEIIVVNDGSKDMTKELVEEFIKKNQTQIKISLINQENQGKGKAMNVGLEKTSSEFFACLDADSFVAPNALKEMLSYFEDDLKVAAVCPLLKVKKPSSILQKVQWYEYVINMFYKKLNAKLDCIHVTPGPFSIYRTKVIKDLGGYDENNITEDLEIAIRLQKYHYKIIQTFDAIVETVAPNNWKSLFWQRIRWYKGSVDNTISYKKMIFNKEYGDFGYMRMPTILFSGVVAIVLSITLLHELITSTYHGLSSLQAVNFDIITLIRNINLNFNFLSLPISKYFIATTLVLISLFVMVYSYKVVKEKITNHGKTFASLVTYLCLYGLFLTVVWVYIGFMMVTKKKSGW